MIRINLVAERRAQKSTGVRLDIGHKITVAGSVIVLVTVLLIGWRYWALSQDDTRLTADIEAARREEARLAEVLKQVTQFEAQRSQLQQRVTLIDELRKGQTAPVHIIDQLSRSLPEMTWLTSLKQDGYDITIEGRSTSLAALSDLVGNLEATRFFQRPVEIVSSQIESGPSDTTELVTFIIKGKFQMSGLDTRPPAKVPGQRGN